MNALPSLSDPSFCPDSANKHGVWDVPKTYFHLYEENKITMNWDVPLSAFNGKTAFEMTVEGFACHKSQHWTWFNDWIHGKAGSPVEKASDIKTYSPCEYGLYRTTVGNDTVGGDFLENIVLYKDQIPPETEPTKPEISTESATTTDIAFTTEEAENSDVGVIDSKMIIVALVVTMVVIALIFIIVSASASNHKKNKYRYHR